MDYAATAQEDHESMHTADDMFYSPEEKENLLHIRREFDGEFAVEDVFSTRRHLIDAMRHKAATFGFFIVDAECPLLALKQLQGRPQTQEDSMLVNCVLRNKKNLRAPKMCKIQVQV
jgi:hypothetical protein